MEYLTISNELANRFKAAFPDAAHAELHKAIEKGEADEIFSALRNLGGDDDCGEYRNFDAAQNDAAGCFRAVYHEVYTEK